MRREIAARGGAIAGGRPAEVSKSRGGIKGRAELRREVPREGSESCRTIDLMRVVTSSEQKRAALLRGTGAGSSYFRREPPRIVRRGLGDALRVGLYHEIVVVARSFCAFVSTIEFIDHRETALYREYRS